MKLIKLILYIAGGIAMSGGIYATYHIITHNSGVREIVAQSESNTVDSVTVEKEIAEEILGEHINHFTKVEDGVYIASDGSMILIVDDNKWEEWKKRELSKFQYQVTDAENGNPFIMIEDSNYQNFKFVGILQIYENGADAYEYHYGEGKMFSNVTELIYWNCSWCEGNFDMGKNVSNEVFIEK